MKKENKNKTMKKLLLTLTFILSTTSLCAQRHQMLTDNIASLQVVAGQKWLSMPVIPLGGRERIHISFDDLTHEYHRYAYRIVHCQADWQPSTELFDTDYMDGFAEGNTIDDMVESINTNTLYTHYKLSIPNSRCRLKLSGNYRLTVYDDDSGEDVLHAYFMVAEDKVKIQMGVTTDTDIDVNASHQQVEMKVNYGPLQVTRPDMQIYTVVLQNGRWDNARINVKPQYETASGLEWKHCRDLIFDGGNEYHKFEILDVDHPTMGIDRIRWDGEMYHVYPFEDSPRRSYVYDEDANGAFYIRNSDNVENDRTCEYVWVHFVKPGPQTDDEVYVNGQWTYDRFTPRYLMTYDQEKKAYTVDVLMKQGYYSYQYLSLDANDRTHPAEGEGSFFETENTYQALVYYRDMGGRTDRLVGFVDIRKR